jgi:hypothetical protein
MTQSVLDASSRTLERSEPFIVGFDPLKAMTRDERKVRLEAYLAFLKRRDGEPNIPARQLSKREEFFASLNTQPVRSTYAVDRPFFDRHLNAVLKDPKDVDRRLIWLLAAAKSNRVEHYGVELDLRLKGASFAALEHGEHMTYIDLEEFYHTRILRDACKVFGIEYDLHPPRSFMRFYAALVVRSPPTPRLITALCGELFGCVAFQVLWEAVDAFASEPAVFERLRLLVREILIDELGHVAYGHAMLGPAGLAVARALAPTAAAYLLRDVPEFWMLAGDRKKFLERVNAFDLGSNADLWEMAKARARPA